MAAVVDELEVNRPREPDRTHDRPWSLPPRWPVRTPLFLRRVLAIMRAESRYLLRAPLTLVIIVAQPVMLLLLYGYAINFELRHVPFVVWDRDRSASSRALIRQLDPGVGGKRPLELAGYVSSPAEIERLLASGSARFALVVPRNFEREVAAGGQPKVQALFDATDSNTAGIAAGYVATIVATHSARLAADTLARRGRDRLASGGERGDSTGMAPLNLRWRVFYNPDLSSHRFIIPGLIAILLSNIAGTLTATTLTRERELGSIEALLTSPVGAADLVLGKMLPYLVVAALDVVLVMAIGGALFGIVPRGSLLVLGAFTLLFLLDMLGIGMCISAVASTQLRALLLALTITMLPNFFLTGFAFPRSNMPAFLQWLSLALPATHYLVAIRGIFLKGVSFGVLWAELLFMSGMAVAAFALAILATRSRLRKGLE
jgi:ABC-2 type transport system permease protein